MGCGMNVGFKELWFSTGELHQGGLYGDNEDVEKELNAEHSF